MPPSNRLFALTTRGLENLSAQEIAALPGAQILTVAYRRVVFQYTGALRQLLGLRTVDDVFLAVARWTGIVRQRHALSRLRQGAARLDLRQAASTCTQLYPIPASPTALRFSITVSFVGKRNYSTQEIKDLCAEFIAARHGWAYTPDDASAHLNVRLFIEHDIAHVGVRLGETPLHRRAYKQAHVLGSLKPPVAAAMLITAGLEPGMRLLDPCCGAATLLIEGALWGTLAHGGDIASPALEAAQANMDAAGVIVDFAQWDAQKLPLAGHSVARVASNPPWGRAVDVHMDIKTFYTHLCAEIQRVLRPDGRVALLTSLPDLVQFSDLSCTQDIEISLFGQTPHMLVYSR